MIGKLWQRLDIKIKQLTTNQSKKNFRTILNWLRNEMLKKLLFVIILLTFFPAISSSLQLEDYEKGELAGGLGFGAMTMDAYYEICYSNGTRTDNHLNGINKLLKDKWNLTYSEIAAEQEKLTGRNYRQEAHTLVEAVVKKVGSCKSEGMKQWFMKFQEIHENNLRKFNSAE